MSSKIWFSAPVLLYLLLAGISTTMCQDTGCSAAADCTTCQAGLWKYCDVASGNCGCGNNCSADATCPTCDDGLWKICRDGVCQCVEKCTGNGDCSYLAADCSAKRDPSGSSQKYTHSCASDGFCKCAEFDPEDGQDDPGN